MRREQQGGKPSAHDPADHVGEHALPVAHGADEHVLDVALVLGLEQRGRGVGESLAGDGEHEQPGQDELHVLHAGHDIQAVPKRAAEDGQEDQPGDHRRDQRLGPQAQHPAGLAAGQRRGRAPLDDPVRRGSGGHQRMASR